MSEDKGNMSDGYHTFNELYEHRHALFLNLIQSNQGRAFKTLRNQRNEQWDGWFIAGLNTEYGQITYHLPISYWDKTNAKEVYNNADYDGHTSADVVRRLMLLLQPSASSEVDATETMFGDAP